MSDAITPALTAKEWAKAHHWIQCYDSWDDERAKSGVGEISASPTRLTLTSHQCGEFADFSAPTDRHALAALALHGQPFGFTKDDLVGLCALSQKFDQETQVFLGYRNVDRAEFLRSLADRIAALLPP